MRRGEKGFTLAEIAMVLIIIAALLTGVLLTGDAVLRRVRLASLLSGIKDLATAAQSFKTRYGYFPGDLPAANTYLTANGPVSAGCIYAAGGNVGNGIVDTAIESNCGNEHLVKAGLLTKIDYDGVNYVITSTIAPNVQLSLWFNALTNDNAIRITNLPCEVALEIDRKFDSNTVANTPFSQGWLTAQDGLGAQIAACAPGGANDPVPTVLIKY